MSYLPLTFDNSGIFAKEIIAIRPDVHITVSSGIFPNKTARKTGTTSPIFELSYNRKNTLSGEVNNTPVELLPGYASLGFLGQTIGHSEYDSGQEIQLYSIWVSPHAFDGFCEAVCGKSHLGFDSFQKKSYSCCTFKSDAREEAIMKKMDVLVNSDNRNLLLLESYILELLSLNIERLLCKSRPKEQLNRLSKTDMEQLLYAREVLLNRLDRPPSLFELSHIIHMNDCKLKRSFKQYFGTTVYGFIRDERLEKAFSLLQQEDYNVSEAAFAVGYTNASHFSEAFQKKFGIAPRTLCTRKAH